MAANHENRPERFSVETVPPFWLRDDEAGRELLDQRVVKVARENWPWSFRLATYELQDGALASEIVEFIAIEVSKRLRADPAVLTNLTGYYRTAYVNRVRALAERNGRIRYEGSPTDLELNHQPLAADWFKVFEDQMVLKALLPFTRASVRRILGYRMLDFSWKEIAAHLGISEKQAKSRFYYGIQQAREELAAAQKKRAREEASAP
jgi:DNA-directed RNA polymerase specialized sigma24 family protein